MKRIDPFLRVSFLPLLLFAGLATAKPGVCLASAFKVTPVKILLTRRAPTALLTVKNQSDKRLRFQAGVFAWDQDPDGRMQVTPTQDIVFFPTVLFVEPGEERKVRLGNVAPFGALERAYRIFFEELPEPEKRGDSKTTQLHIRTRVGIPIFLRPEKPGPGSRLYAASLREGLLHFSVRNTGNVHVSLAGVRVTGLGRSGDLLFERQYEGWYVLAGGARNYEIEVPEGKCRQIARLVLEARIDEKTLVEKIDLSPAACGKNPVLSRENRREPLAKAPRQDQRQTGKPAE